MPALAAAFACVQVPRASSAGGRSMPPTQLWTADSMADPLTAIPAMQAPTPSPNSVPPMMMLRESTVNSLPEPSLVFITHLLMAGTILTGGCGARLIRAG